MTTIHHVDPGPITNASVEPPPPWRSPSTSSGPTCRRAKFAERPDLAKTLDHLADTQPDQTPVVVCHGDLHPLNLLQDHDGAITVLDWTGAAIAPAAYDVALAHTFLRHPPLQAPSALRPAINAPATRMARRFPRHYQHANPATDLGDLDWYRALHAARILVDLSTWTRAGDARSGSHPWHFLASAAARTLRNVTGVNIRAQGSIR